MPVSGQRCHNLTPRKVHYLLMENFTAKSNEDMAASVVRRWEGIFEQVRHATPSTSTATAGGSSSEQGKLNVGPQEKVS